MAAAHFACHSSMAIHFCGVPDFLQEHSQLWSSSLPASQAVSMQPTAVLSPGLLSKPHVPTPNPCVHQWTHVSGWGAQSCGKDYLCRSHSVLPATDQFLSSLWAPEAPFLSQLISPLLTKLPQESLSSPSPPSQGRRSCPTSTFLFFLFSLSSCPVTLGPFLVLLGVQVLLLAFSRCSVRTVPFVEVFLMYLWVEVNSMSSYSTIFTPPPYTTW